MKKCSICNLEKDFSFFYTNKLSKDGLFKCCKKCHLERGSKRIKEKIKSKSEDIGALLSGERFESFDKNLLVSNFGRVFLKENSDNGIFTRARFLPQTLLKNGYYTVNYKYKKIYVHRLVAYVFLDNLQNYSHVNHINLNKKDNNFKNLEWCTNSQNIDHAIKNDAYSVKLNRSQILEIRESNLTVKELASIYKVSTTNISLILKRKIWKHVL